MVAFTYGRSTYNEAGAPGSNAFTITPNDTDEFEFVTRGIYVGGAGTIVVQMDDGATVTFVAVPVGMVLPIKVRKVLSTGTTATNLVGLI